MRKKVAAHLYYVYDRRKRDFFFETEFFFGNFEKMRFCGRHTDETFRLLDAVMSASVGG